MSLVNGAVDSLLDGVSQEPATTRLVSQATEQINGWSSPTYGLVKRPPATLIKVMAAGDPTVYNNALVHTIRRTPTDQHKVIIKNGDIEVYDALTGNTRTVVKTGTSYLSTSNPNKDIRCLTVGDTTFIVNRNQVVTNAKTTSPPLVNGNLVFIRSVDYGTLYGVSLSVVPGDSIVSTFEPVSPGQVPSGQPVVLGYTTPIGDTAAQRALISTNSIASALYTLMMGNATLTGIYNFALLGSTIAIVRKDGQRFRVLAQDGLGDTAVGVVRNTVQNFTDLPAVAPNGYMCEVLGAPDSLYDNYWVVYDAVNTVDNHGVWRETVAPGVQTDFDASTMPHQLVEQPATTETITGTPLFTDFTLVPSTLEQLGVESSSPWIGILANANGFLTNNGDTLSAVFGGLAGIVTKDAVMTATFDVDTRTMDTTNAITLILECENAPASGVYDLVSSRIYQPGVFIANETLKGTHTISNAATQHARLRLVYDAAPTLKAVITAHAQTSVRGAGFKSSPIIGTLVTFPRNLPCFPIQVGTGLTSGSFGFVCPAGVNFSWTQADSTSVVACCAAVQAGLLAAGLVGAGMALIPIDSYSFAIQWTSLTTTGIPGVTVTRTPVKNGIQNALVVINTTKTYVDGALVGLAVTDVTQSLSAGTVKGNNQLSFVTDSVLVYPAGDVFTLPISTTPTFIFGPAIWRSRECGDDITNPFPSFVTKPIQDIFLREGRLGILAGHTVVLSGSVDLFNFFRQSALQLFASDLIDVSSASSRPSYFHSAVEWDSRLYLFSDQQMFEMAGAPLLSPDTVSLHAVLDIESSRNMRPFPSGRRIFVPRGRANTLNISQVLEIARAPNSDGLVVTDSTKHIPSYTIGGPLQMTGDDGNGVAFLLTDQFNFYPHFYQYQDGLRVQNSWSRWIMFNATIINADYYNGLLTLVTQHTSLNANQGLCLEQIDLTNAPGDSTVHLDTGTDIYLFEYILSTIYARRVMRDYQTRLDRMADLQMRYVNMRYVGTRSFLIIVNNPLRANYTTIFSSAVGAEGQLKFAVMGKNTDITVTVQDASTLPCRFTGFDWEATYSTRSQRL